MPDLLQDAPDGVDAGAAQQFPPTFGEGVAARFLAVVKQERFDGGDDLVANQARPAEEDHALRLEDDVQNRQPLVLDKTYGHRLIGSTRFSQQPQ